MSTNQFIQCPVDAVASLSVCSRAKMVSSDPLATFVALPAI